MSKAITLLKSASDHALAKISSGTALKQQPFSIGSLFDVTEEPVSDLHSLSALLQRLEDDPTHTVIRGVLKESQSSTVPRDKETFTTKPRQWCMIDIDSLAWDGAFDNQQALVAHAVQHLPNEFQSSNCWYHFSSSMGIKAGIRVHLWYWLERPCSDDELKAWLSGYPVDMSLFNPIQIHLTANPRFIEGATDPFPQRSGMFEAGNGIKILMNSY